MEEQPRRRRLPVGAEVLPNGGVEFRVWAPKHARVEVVIEGAAGAEASGAPLEPEGAGYHSGLVRQAGPGTLYRYRTAKGDFPDPASRFQPRGPHGPSQVVDPAAYRWSDGGWPGLVLRGQVIYELHVGTFTPEGTWRAAVGQLPALVDLGITALLVMPPVEFAGRFGWGYDGVGLFAPYHHYGTPDEMRRFVDRAHGLGLGVLIDVVYNHVGPDGSYFRAFSDAYFSTRHASEWGDTLNFDGEGSGPVREFVLANGAYWIEEFHADGLRIDAVQGLFDDSAEHIVAALARRARAAGGGRAILVVGEHEQQDARLARPVERGGRGLDALYNEDFHHVAMIAAVGRTEGYYADYAGSAQEFVSLFKRGWLYQGQYNARQGQSRGAPAFDLAPPTFVNYLQNHDQVANTLRGDRLARQVEPAALRALTTVFLLAPGTPLIFQGQEFAASTPFHYFGDQKPEIAEMMRAGRRDFLGQFESLATEDAQRLILDPADAAVFEGSKLRPAEREAHAEAVALHRDLLRLRRTDPVFRLQGSGGLDGAVLGPSAFAIRFFGADGDDRLLIANFGTTADLSPMAEPLLALAGGRRWDAILSSEDVRYGGSGTPPLQRWGAWRLPGRAAFALAPGRDAGGGRRDA